MQNNKKKYLGRGIGSVLACIVVSVLLSVGSLYFATDKYGIEMFQSYFENGYIVFLNTLPVFFSIMFVFLICNQLWIGISITSILVIVLSLINYFKLLFRDNPFLVDEYSRAVTPQIRQAGNRLSGLAETAYASLLA